MPKPFEKLTFSDDWMFQKVLHDPEICAELVERLLHISVGRVEYPELEKVIEPFYTSKGVRLDVYLKDSDKVIDIELQSYPMDTLGKRIRYYESMLNMDALMKGQDYTLLKDSYIVFICTEDPFKNNNEIYYGLPCYTFRNICEENNTVDLSDKSLKVIYNASAYEKAEDKRIREFLRFIHTQEPGEDDFNKRLSEHVAKIKENEEFRSEYAAMNLHGQDIIRIAKKEASEEKAIENAKTMLSDKLSPDKVSHYSGLPLKQVLELQKQIPVKA